MFIQPHFEVPVDAQTNVELSRSLTDKLPSPYNDCINVDARSLAASPFAPAFANDPTAYTQQRCFGFCGSRYVADHCHCTYVAYTTMNFSRPTCRSFADYECAVRAFALFYRHHVAANCSRDCPPECSSSAFAVSSTWSNFPEPTYYYYMLARGDETLARREFGVEREAFRRAIEADEWSGVPSRDEVVARLRGKTLSLNVYYGSVAYTHVSESPQMSLLDLIAGVGGMLGLFVGMSFMTFMEAVELVLKVLIIVVEGSAAHLARSKVVSGYSKPKRNK